MTPPLEKSAEPFSLTNKTKPGGRAPVAVIGPEFEGAPPFLRSRSWSSLFSQSQSLSYRAERAKWARQSAVVERERGTETDTVCVLHSAGKPRELITNQHVGCTSTKGAGWSLFLSICLHVCSGLFVSLGWVVVVVVVVGGGLMCVSVSLLGFGCSLRIKGKNAEYAWVCHYSDYIGF